MADARSVAPSNYSASGAKRRKSCADLGEKASIADIKAAAQDTTLQSINDHLKGDSALQLVVLHALQTGQFSGKATKEPETVKGHVAAASNNKFNLLTIGNWSDVLAQVDPVKYPAEVTLKMSKPDLLRIACYHGCVDPSSALPSRRLDLIAKLLISRSVDITHNRGAGVTITVAEEGRPQVTIPAVYSVMVLTADDKKDHVPR